MIFNVLPAAFARSGKRKAGPPAASAPAPAIFANWRRVNPPFFRLAMLPSLAFSASSEIGREVAVLRLAQEKAADHERHQCHDDRIPETGVNVALGGDDRGGEQR